MKFVMKRVVAVDSQEREESTGKRSELLLWGCSVIAEAPGDFLEAPDEAELLELFFLKRSLPLCSLHCCFARDHCPLGFVCG